MSTGLFGLLVNDDGSVSSQPMGHGSHVSLEASAPTTEGTSSVNVNYIVYLKNDGTNNIVFNFDGAANTASGGFTLKGGESISNVPVKCGVLHYVASTSATAFRFLGAI